MLPQQQGAAVQQVVLGWCPYCSRLGLQQQEVAAAVPMVARAVRAATAAAAVRLAHAAVGTWMGTAVGPALTAMGGLQRLQGKAIRLYL